MKGKQFLQCDICGEISSVAANLFFQQVDVIVKLRHKLTKNSFGKYVNRSLCSGPTPLF